MKILNRFRKKFRIFFNALGPPPGAGQGRYSESARRLPANNSDGCRPRRRGWNGLLLLLNWLRVWSFWWFHWIIRYGGTPSLLERGRRDDSYPPSHAFAVSSLTCVPSPSLLSHTGLVFQRPGSRSYLTTNTAHSLSAALRPGSGRSSSGWALGSACWETHVFSIR